MLVSRAGASGKGVRALAGQAFRVALAVKALIASVNFLGLSIESPRTDVSNSQGRSDQGDLTLSKRECS